MKKKHLKIIIYLQLLIITSETKFSYISIWLILFGLKLFLYRDLSNKIEVIFIDKNEQNDDGFTLMLSCKMKYDEFAKSVAKHLNWDYLKLQFFKPTSCYDLKVSMSQPIRYNPDYQLQEAFPNNKNNVFRRLLYQKVAFIINDDDFFFAFNQVLKF